MIALILDINLAVWGLNPKDYFRAVGQSLALHPDIPINLIETESAPTRLIQEIETIGIIAVAM